MAFAVEVMIPAYGDGPLIRDAIRSVIDQDDKDWKLTIVDDAAGFEHGEMASWLRTLADSRISYLANPQRLGINRNFQRCVDVSSADWVIVLGADDRLLPNCISQVRRTIADFAEVAWIHTGAIVIDRHGRPHKSMADRVKKLTAPKVGGRRVIGGEQLAVTLLRGNWMYFPSCAFRREVLQRIGFRVDYDIVLDLDLYLRILLDGGSCVLLERPGIEYRRHSASLSSTGADDGSRFAEEGRYFEKTATVMTLAGWPRAATAARQHWASRLHAAASVPSVLVNHHWRAAMALARFAVSTPSRRPPNC